MNQKTYTLETDYAPIIKAEVELPNPEPVDPLLFLSNLASGGHSLVPKWGWALVEGRKDWAQYFLTPAGMGGRFDGGGYAVVWRNSRYDQETKKQVHQPLVVRFAICKHENVAGPGANPLRGWHPGSCKHCGLDMTVDSGD